MKDQIPNIKATTKPAEHGKKSNSLTSKTLVEFAIDKAKNSKRETWEASVNMDQSRNSK